MPSYQRFWHNKSVKHMQNAWEQELVPFTRDHKEEAFFFN